MIISLEDRITEVDSDLYLSALLYNTKTGTPTSTYLNGLLESPILAEVKELKGKKYGREEANCLQKTAI